MEKKISYVILDNQNRWQATGYDETQEEVDETIQEVKDNLKRDGEEVEFIELLLFEIVGKPQNV